MKITMLGAGAFGKALGQVLTDNGHIVSYYDPILAMALVEALDGTEAVVLCVPSCAVLDLLPKLPKKTPLIVTTKGFLSTDVFADFDKVMVMSGPGFAKDIVAHKHTILTATAALIPKLFRTDYLRFDFSRDVEGVLMCGALKNAYAIQAGKSRLKPGSNKWKHYIDVALREMAAILKANGANPDTVKCACGVGDLELTCSPDSRNFEFGSKVASDSGYRSEKTVEGLATLERIREGAIKVPEEALILRELMQESLEWV